MTSSPETAYDLRLLHRLGRGSFGEVFVAERTTPGGLRGRVAVKLLPSGLHADDPAVRRLRDEAAMLAQLRHSGILTVHDLIERDGRVGLIAELIDGADLHDCIHGLDPIGPRALVQVIDHTAEALDAAWSAIGPSGAPLRLVHRDIKPTNLRISARGELKVLDFGVARANIEGRAASTGGAGVLGSVAYMAPERLRPGGPSDHPSGDVFALGCVLFEGYARARLFEGIQVPTAIAIALDPAEHAAFIERRIAGLDAAPHGVRELLREMLATDPAARPSAAQVATRCEALAPTLEGPTLRAWAKERAWPEPGAPATGPAEEPTTLDELLDTPGVAVGASVPGSGRPDPRDRWEIGEVLGTSAGATLYRAKDRHGGEVRSAKVIRAAGHTAEKATERYHREVKLLGQTDHPGLPRLVDAFEVGPRDARELWIVTELIDGPSLADELARRRYAEDEVLHILDEVAGILGYLHARQPPIVHRDVRPENIRRAPDGRLVLGDLGSALDRVLDPELGGATFAGSFGYMAPEQNAGDADPRSDLYGLGALGAALLTRETPHALVGPDQRVDFASRVQVASETERLLDELLAPEPDARPTSIAVVRDRIGALLRQPEPTALAHPEPPRRRRVPWAGLGVSAAALGFLGVGTVVAALMIAVGGGFLALSVSGGSAGAPDLAQPAPPPVVAPPDGTTLPTPVEPGDAAAPMRQVIAEPTLADLQGGAFARAVPVHGGDGAITGYELQSVPSDAPLYKLGLRDGDVLHGINGTPIDSLAALKRIVGAGATSATTELDVTRRGVREILVLQNE